MLCRQFTDRLSLITLAVARMDATFFPSLPLWALAQPIQMPLIQPLERWQAVALLNGAIVVR